MKSKFDYVERNQELQAKLNQIGEDRGEKLSKKTLEENSFKESTEPETLLQTQVSVAKPVLHLQKAPAAAVPSFQDAAGYEFGPVV